MSTPIPHVAREDRSRHPNGGVSVASSRRFPRSRDVTSVRFAESQPVVSVGAIDRMDGRNTRMRPLLALLVALNIAVWGGLFAFENALAHGVVTISSTATMSHRDAQSLGR
jgi:hypothetical protein